MSIWGGGYASAAASAFGALESYRGQQSANATNIKLAQQNRDWETQMSNTAHQREVKDLTAAGLNPLLSVNGGASTPSAPVATVQNPWQGAAGLISQSAQQLMQARATQAQIDNTNADTNLKKANTPGTATVTIEGDEDGPDLTVHTGGGVLGDLNANQLEAQLNNTRQTWHAITADIANTQSDTSVKDATAKLTNVNADMRKDMYNTLVAQASEDLKLTQEQVQSVAYGNADAAATAKVYGSKYGPWLKALNALMGSNPINTAIGLHKHFGGGNND